jgi:hypothetical protein
MTKVCLGFETVSQLQLQVKSWITKDNSLAVEYADTLNDGSFCLFVEKSLFEKTGGKLSLLDFVYQGTYENSTIKFDLLEPQKVPESKLQSKPLWSLLQWDEYKTKQDTLYVKIEQNFLNDFVLLCIKHHCFEISSSKLSDNSYFVMVYKPTAYIMYKSMEEFGIEVFWKDSSNTFLPWKKAHPLMDILNRDDSIRIISHDSMIVLKSLEFVSITKNINWTFEGSEYQLDTNAQAPKINIRLSFIEDKHQRVPNLWYYSKDQYNKLEQWVINLPASERSHYKLAIVEKPLQGFLVWVPDPEQWSMASTPQSSLSFYANKRLPQYMFPFGFELYPVLPNEEFQQVFPLRPGKILIFDQQAKSNKALMMELLEADFFALEELVNYVLDSQKEEIETFKSKFSFDDPRIIVISEATGEEVQDKTNEKARTYSARKSEPKQKKDESQVKDDIQVSKQTLSQDEKEELVAELEQLRFLIIQNPEMENIGNWSRLSHIEYLLENWYDAILAGDLAKFFSFGSHDTGLDRVLLYCYENHKGYEQGSVWRKLKSHSFESFDDKDVQVLGFCLMAYHKSFTDKIRDFYSNRYIQILENTMDQIPVVRLFNFCSVLHHHVGKDSYFLLKVKDQILAKLYNQKIWSLSELPAFVGKHNFGSSAIEQEQIEGIFQTIVNGIGGGATAINERLGVYLCKSIAYAKNGDSSKASAQLFEARKYLSMTRNPVHEFLFDYYSERVNRKGIIDESTVDKLMDKSGSRLTMVQKYQVERIVTFTTGKRELSKEFVSNREYVGLSQRTSSELKRLIPDLLVRLQQEKTISPERMSWKKKEAYLAVLDQLPRLGEQYCFNTLKDIHALAKELPKTEHKATLIGKMLEVSYIFNSREWIDKLIQEFKSMVDNSMDFGTVTFEAFLLPLTEHFQKLGGREELLGLFESQIARAQPGYHGSLIKILLAQLYAQVGNNDKGLALIEDVLSGYKASEQMEPQQRFDLLVFLLQRMNVVSSEMKQSVAKKLASIMPAIHDHFSTNEHYSLSRYLAMEFMSALGADSDKDDPELKRYLYEFEYLWKQKFFEKLAILGIGRN